MGKYKQTDVTVANTQVRIQIKVSTILSIQVNLRMMQHFVLQPFGPILKFLKKIVGIFIPFSSKCFINVSAETNRELMSLNPSLSIKFIIKRMQRDSPSSFEGFYKGSRTTKELKTSRVSTATHVISPNFRKKGSLKTSRTTYDISNQSPVSEIKTQVIVFCAVFQRVLCDACLRESFLKIKMRVTIKRVSLSLLKNCQIKYLQSAFFTIKELSQQKALDLQTTFIEQDLKFNFFGKQIQKIQSRHKNYAFKSILGFFKRQKDRKAFICALESSYQNFSSRHFKQSFLSKLKLHSSKLCFISNTVFRIHRFQCKVLRRQKLAAFRILKKQSFLGPYERVMNARKDANKERLEIGTERKKQILAQKESLRKVKLQFDSVRLENNRFKSEIRKQKGLVKQKLNIDIKESLKEIQDLERQIQSLEANLSSRKSLADFRQQRSEGAGRSNAANRLMVVCQKLSEEQSREIVKPQTIVNSLQSDIDYFRSHSAEFHLRESLELSKAIRTYEKIPETSEQESHSYLQQIQQNRCLKQFLSEVIRREADRFVSSQVVLQRGLDQRVRQLTDKSSVS